MGKVGFKKPLIYECQCLQCGTHFRGCTPAQRFCCTQHRHSYNNRKKRLGRNLNAEPSQHMSEKDIERFWSKVDIRDHDDCWGWKGSRAKRRGGYGIFSWNSDTWKAHRVAWALTNGPIQTGLSVLHKCDNPSCVNPNHLFLGTDGDNNRDMDAKGRRVPPRGERNAHAKLTADKAKEIRVRYSAGGVSYASLAHEFNVAKGTIQRVIERKTWDWVE